MTNIEAYKKYTAPESAGSYFKLQDGKSAKVRIASDAYVYFDSYKGVPKTTPSYAWVIWNFTEARAQVLQASLTVFKSIQALILDDDWGDPEEYNLTIRREGVLKETKYHVTPSPQKSALKDVLDASQLEQIGDFDINSLMGDKELVALADVVDGVEVPISTPDNSGQTDSGDVVIEDLPEGKINLDDIPF